MPVTKVTTHADFLKEYSFPQKPAQDFERNGSAAEFASGHPFDWHSFAESIDFGKEMPESAIGAYKSFTTALSADEKLLAISSNEGRILIYDISCQEMRASLEGSGRVVFRPVCNAENDGYMLISSSPNHKFGAADYSNGLVLWDLDQHGRVLDEEEPIDCAMFATKAIEAILPELISEHEWSKEFVQTSSLHAKFEAALDHIAAEHRRRHHTVLKNARLGDFGSVAFGSDGRLLIYHSENRTTQHSIRQVDALPRVVVYDVVAGKELHCLSGHTDAIMWSAISPNNEHIASVSWDGTMRMYSTLSGNLQWATEQSGGQSWTGAFTPDSKHIVWSCASGLRLQVHDVRSGSNVSTFRGTFNDWCRDMHWDPAGEQLVLSAGKHVYVWRPFDGPDGVEAQHFVLDNDEKGFRMASVTATSWINDGKALALQFSDGTKLIYNLQSNSKEIFMRPKGLEVAWVNSGFYGVLSGPDQPEFYLMVNGDGKVRFCRPAVPAFPSWWENEPKEKEITTPVKKMYPETGKYVKITKVPSQKAPKEDEQRYSWAENGAKLWTAE